MDVALEPVPNTDGAALTTDRWFSDTEIEAIAKRHPISADVLRIIAEHKDAHRRLFRKVIKTTYNRYRRDHSLKRQPSSHEKRWQPLLDDERASVLNALLGAEIARIKQLPRDGLLQRASAGEFDAIAYTVKHRFTDHLRHEYAEKRGGRFRRDDLESMGPNQTDEGGDGYIDPNALIDRALYKCMMPLDAYDTPVWRIHLQQLDWTPLERQLGTGPATLLRLSLEEPDFKSEELRRRLGVTDRTIRNYRSVLNRNRVLILALIFGRVV